MKLKAPDGAEVFPATSVCRTIAAWAPSPLSAKLVPLPAVQVEPPSVLYSQLAPASSPLTVTVPSLVIPSAAPLSSASARLGVATVVSSVKLKAPDGAEVLPATSVTVAVIG